VESNLFEILGGWIASTPEPDVKLMLDRHSQHSAWRAGQWWERLPVLAGVDRDELVRAPSETVAEAVTALRDLSGSAARLAGAYRVIIPRVAGAYHRHRGSANPLSDSSTLRTLDMIERDIGADWREGEFSLQTLIRDEVGRRAAVATVEALDQILVSQTAHLR
jgi:hypothetical protein